jgi:bifunctional DNA-binding transcriptional regulator/antitoxin component of YhaV-PrlF toxin-antitoxin module
MQFVSQLQEVFLKATTKPTVSPSRIVTTRVQDRGYTTLPQVVREHLGIEKGATVTWVITSDGRVEVQSLKAESKEGLDEFELALQKLGMTYEEWRASRKKFATKWMKERYDIDLDKLPNAQALS